MNTINTLINEIKDNKLIFWFYIFENNGFTLSDLSNNTKIHKSQVYIITKSFLDRDYIKKYIKISNCQVYIINKNNKTVKIMEKIIDAIHNI